MNDDLHGPRHVGTGCLTCNQQGGQPPVAGPHLAAVRVTARGEEFRVVQLKGQSLVLREATWQLLLWLGRKGSHADRSSSPVG